ncbi:hypothetical protein LX36DRAFT_659492, partial [Colletotrichum falcatum]
SLSLSLSLPLSGAASTPSSGLQVPAPSVRTRAPPSTHHAAPFIRHANPRHYPEHEVHDLTDACSDYRTVDVGTGRARPRHRH